MTTPLRLADPRPAQLPRPEGDDSLAGRLMMALDAAADLSSWSDELTILAGTTIDRYHLAPSRANILRALDLPTDSAVLEIGARAGVLTRHLGETYEIVDALEPDPALAAVAIARCVGLTSVAVHTAWFDAVPAAPAYDLVVAADVADVLQQHGGTLEDLVLCSRALLRPGGMLLLAFDNAEGVRFLAGDAVASVGESAESLPPRMSIDAVTAAVTDAGLRPALLGAFPDHRHAHVLFDHDGLAAVDPTLLTKLPPYGSEVERQLWAEMVRNGTSAAHANSVVVLASETGRSTASVATYWSDGRAAAQSACNRLRIQDDHAVVVRGRAFPEAPAPDGPLELRPHTEKFLDGTSLVRVLAETSDVDEAGALLRGWADLVRASTSPGGPVLWDLIPRNVIVLPDGDLCPIDQEWVLHTGSAATVLGRGCFWLAVDLSSLPWEPTWLHGVTIRDRALFLHALAGCDHDAHWFETFVEDEAHHVSYVWPSSTRHPRAATVRESWMSLNELSTHRQNQSTPSDSSPDTSSALASVINDLSASNSELRAEVDQLKLQQRHATLVQRDHLIGLNAEMERLREQLTAQRRSTRRAKLRASKAEKQLAAVRSSSTWRVGRMLTRPLALLRRKR